MIYVLEDDANIRKLVDYALTREGYSVEGFGTPADFWAAVGRQLPQLVLLDIMLPQEDGLSVLQKLRSRSDTRRLPVIMLTARSSEFDKVTGLDSGADDYIAKPFGMELAISKIGAVLRRAYDLPAASSQLHAGNAVLDLQEAALVSGSEKTSLSKNEFLILRILFEHKNSPVSREELIRALWNDESFIDDNTLTVNIARIRKKLEEIGLRDFIQTRKGLGYLIEEKVHD